MKKSARKNNKQRVLLKAHRYIGLLSFLVLVWLSVSGLLLNHTEELELDQRFSRNTTLLSLYNIPTPKVNVAFSQENDWIYLLNQTAYYNEKKLQEATLDNLVGAVLVKDIIALATPTAIKLYLPTGEYIDELALQGTAKAIGLSDQSIAVKTENTCLLLNEDLTDFIVCEAQQKTQWIKATEMPEQTQLAFLKHYQGDGISVERILLDTHSGRIFNSAGVYFMDLMALLIIVLAVSGTVLWTMRKLNKRRSRKR